MKKIVKISTPFLLILLGFSLLALLEMAIPAGVFILVGIVMIIEKIWPEEWALGN